VEKEAWETEKTGLFHAQYSKEGTLMERSNRSAAGGYGKAVREFLKTSSCRIPFQHDELIQSVVYGWGKFLELPPNIKNQWCFGDNRGLVRRRGGLHDPNKDFFHIHAGEWGLRRSLGVRGVKLNLEQSAFLTSCEKYYSVCLEAVLELARLIDEEIPDLHLVKRLNDRRSLRQHVLRLLWYGPTEKKGEVRAKRHPDKSCITLHSYENIPGLQVRDRTKDTPYYTEEGSALVFAGDKLERVTEGTIPTVWHGAFAPENAERSEPRVVLVFFSHIYEPPSSLDVFSKGK